jgi:transposase-like protein
MEKTGILGEALFRRKRKRWPRSVWVKEIKAFRDSGLSAEEYAAKRGIHIVTLRRWVRRVAGDGGPDKRSALPAFVPVRVVGSPERPAIGCAFQVEIELANGRRLRAQVGADADVKRLADLLEVLDGAERC